jgi:hypothetical protein
MQALRIVGFASMLFGPIATVSNARAATPSFVRVSEKPCRALALDKEPHWAALGSESVTVQDKYGSHQYALPPALHGQGELGVFFGRDYRVRVAGTLTGEKGAEMRYYRYLPGGLRPAHDELGPLGKAGGPALVALLGTADPEIVCRPGMSCLIKRVSGWKTASAPEGLSQVGLSLGTGWALAGQKLYRLDKDWAEVGESGPWLRGTDAFVRGQQACVLEHAKSAMHHFDGERWHSAASPVKGPRSLWGSEQSLWIAGDGGVARFNDGQFRTVPAAPAGVRRILGRDANDIWVCGEHGVHRIVL